MAEDFFECPELTGKTIHAVRVYESPNRSNEVLIEFTDGTSFSCTLETKCATAALLFRQSDGVPVVLRDYRS